MPQEDFLIHDTPGKQWNINATEIMVVRQEDPLGGAGVC